MQREIRASARNEKRVALYYTHTHTHNSLYYIDNYRQDGEREWKTPLAQDFSEALNNALEIEWDPFASDMDAFSTCQWMTVFGLRNLYLIIGKQTKRVFISMDD